MKSRHVKSVFRGIFPEAPYEFWPQYVKSDPLGCSDHLNPSCNIPKKASGPDNQRIRIFNKGFNSVTKAAEGLGVSRTSLSELLNGRRGISPEMAIRLSMAFGGSAESWITQQGVERIKRQVRTFA
ncbi:MAG: HigA family addiction module antidote protein [Deltaproteobacteria bacterium]|nr:HigA family addiction module antidote protein [Deltaproteobacteria bacterium]